MQCLNTFRISALKLFGTGPVQPHITVLVNSINRKSTFRYVTKDKKPGRVEKENVLRRRSNMNMGQGQEDDDGYTAICRLSEPRLLSRVHHEQMRLTWGIEMCFDMRNVSIVRGNDSHAQMITSFLNMHYWPREPSVIGLWMPLDSPYLQFLSDKFSYIGERLMAMEYQPRIRENRMIGLSVANRVYPWMISELEQWGHVTDTVPERHRMYFCAHCLKSPNLFGKYKVDYIYDIEVLGTAADVTGQGVGTFLLKAALDSAHEMRHPLVQVVAVSKYAARICEKCGMQQVWTMPYKDFVDKCGQSVFFPRPPHLTVSIYVKYYEPQIGGESPCKPNF